MPNRHAIAPSSGKYKALCALAGLEKAFRRHSQKTPHDLQAIRNFLFLQYDTALGSAVHATPLYEALKRQIPDAHISVAASNMAASVLAYNPYVDRCRQTPLPWQDFRGAVRSVRQLYKQLPEGLVCVVTTSSNQRPKLALLTLLAGNAARVGYTLASPLYDVALDYDADRPQIETNLDIARALGHEVSSPEPRVFFSSQDFGDATCLLAEASTQADHPIIAPRIAFVTQNSGGEPKLWSVDRFRHILTALHATLRATPIFLGTADNATAVEALRQPLAEPGISLVGKTTVPQLAAVLTQCDLIVSLDTGTFHVARAVGLPGVVIAPAWQNPTEWLPVGHSQYRILCRPLIPMPTSKYWIEEISADQVLAAALNLIGAFPPSTVARAARRDLFLAKKES